MGVPSLVFAVPPEGGFTSVPHSTAYPHRSDILSTDFTFRQPGGRSLETRVMLPKRAALKQSPRGGLPRRPLSLPALKDGVSRGEA